MEDTTISGGGTLLAQGKTWGSMLQQHTNKALTTGPFCNTYDADEISPEVEVGVVARLRRLQLKLGHRSLIIILIKELNTVSSSICHQYPLR
jgi:hypothetical protein